jgi:putative DNA methylase
MGSTAMNQPLRKKLIEVALPLPEINDASAYDKMPGIGPHPKGIHHWWARLPLPTARAILFASVVDDPESHPEKWATEDAQNAERERLFDILRRMMDKKLHEAPQVYDEARAEMLTYCDGHLPAVFDPFAGGGSIPLEANRMGFEVHSGDLNPVAVLLNRCNLELVPRWVNCPPINRHDRGRIGGTESWRGTHGLSADIRYYGQAIRERAQGEIGHLYPKVRLPKERGGGEAKVIAWIWARTVASPNPAARGRHVPLVSSFMISRKKGAEVWAEPVFDGAALDGWRFVVRTGTPTTEQVEKARLGTRAGKAQDFMCLVTETPIPRSYIQAEGKAGRLRERIMAIVVAGPTGRGYESPDNEQENIAAAASNDPQVAEARSTFLAGALPNRAGITGGVCSAYGLTTWGSLFTARQIGSMVLLSDLVRKIAADIRTDGLAVGLGAGDADAYAQSVTTFLALAADRCASFNNSLCRWNGNQTVFIFTRQALPMVWDFSEANIMGDRAVCWHTAVNLTADAVETISAKQIRGTTVRQMDAADNNNPITNFMVSTDPPYYNNISYATLSDFFYIWLRRTLGPLYPDLFSTMLVPKLPELTASPDRFEGDKRKAKEHFESGFRRAFSALRAKMDPGFPLTVYYAFKQDDEETSEREAVNQPGVDLTTGWETLLEALISSGFQITATWRVRASFSWRMVALGSNALASYIVLACRPRPVDAPQIASTQFRQELKRTLPAALRHLQQGNIAPVDFAQAALGPGMAVYSRYSRILESTGRPLSVRSAIAVINSY